MKHRYGFTTEKYPIEGSTVSLETLTLGDGKGVMMSMLHVDGCAALGLGYGDPDGVIGKKQTINAYMDKNHFLRWQVKFDNAASVDAVITVLESVKELLLEERP